MKVFKNVAAVIGGEIITTNIVFNATVVSVGGEARGEEIVLPKGAIVCPGFIDRHVHGAGGYDCMDASKKALTTIAQTLAKEGTTAFLATTMTESERHIFAALDAVRDYMQTEHRVGARVLGAHLEGPFISPAYAGAQPKAHIVLPNGALFERYQKASGNAIKQVTVAPELVGAEQLIKRLSSKHIVASIGHTAAKYGHVLRAVEAGATSVTHTYNAQSGLHHRDAGTVGGAMVFDELYTELIADGIHVSAPAMQLLFRAKPADKVTLITDGIRAKGIGDGESELGGQKVFVKNGKATLENGTIAGSVLPMNVAVRNVVNMVGVPLAKAVQCATLNPAKALGVDKEYGSIEVGKHADFAVLDKNLDVLMTIRDGRIIYQAE